MIETNFLKLIDTLPNYISKILSPEYKIEGPALYFHQMALAYQATDFLSERHIEYVYATLVAWGMHRMGPTGAKMPNFEVFQKSILDQKATLIELQGKRIEEINADEIDSVIEKLCEICSSIAGSKSQSHLVSGSKTLAHILPNLVCPMDRQYTYRFFETKSKDTEIDIFKYVMCSMWKFYQNPIHVKSIKPLLGQTFNENFPKIFDNLIIEYIKENSPKKEEIID
ncbi:MAG: hypothetical protein J6R26_05855 [Paludibacteraceae bacterium]|nr:hypothetical protein [Paludibacteraceae bacterium]